MMRGSRKYLIRLTCKNVRDEFWFWVIISKDDFGPIDRLQMLRTTFSVSAKKSRNRSKYDTLPS